MAEETIDQTESYIAERRNLLDVQNLRKYFPITRGFLKRVIGHVRAVDDVSFTIQQGETLGLVGESGCGKTTTARCIMRAIDPSSGEILYRTEDGQVLDIGAIGKGPLRELRKDMQMIFQDPFTSLNPTPSAAASASASASPGHWP